MESSRDRGRRFGQLDPPRSRQRKSHRLRNHSLRFAPKARKSLITNFDSPITGQKIRFVNVEQEQPIGELSAYYVHPGAEPTGVATLRYKLTDKINPADNPSTKPLVDYINGRFPSDERMTMMAMPAGAPGTRRKDVQGGLPIVHILIPADFRSQFVADSHGYSYGWENIDAGLDGIAIDLPALKFQPNADGVIPLNIQIKDPLWPMRDMLYFTFAVKPDTPHTLWLDTRDRILPNGRSLYLTIAAQSSDFGTEALEGAEIRLIFKPYKDALPEHIADRLTQVRDEFANLVEESVSSRRLNLFNRFDGDISDLLRVDPQNTLARDYWHEMNHEQPHPPFTVPQAPPGVPQWAFLQVEDLGYLKRLINWYIDNRQISNGEFGGGLSDDSDFSEWFPGLALMGATPDKIKTSLGRELDAMYAQHMFTNGLATIQTDELHSYEDGLNVLGETHAPRLRQPQTNRARHGHRQTSRVAHRHQRRGPSPRPLQLLQRRKNGRLAASGAGQKKLPTWTSIPRSRSCSLTACQKRAK